MIRYVVAGRVIKYKSPDDIDIRSWREVFEDHDPIVNRQNAIRFYTEYLIAAREAGEIIDERLQASIGPVYLSGTAASKPIGTTDIEVGVFVEIIDIFDERWDGVKVDQLFKFGLGSELKKFLDDQTAGSRPNWDDLYFEDNDLRFVILAPGSQVSPSWLAYALECERNIYDHFGYDKNNFETNVSVFDQWQDQRLERRILFIPFDWSQNDQPSLDTSTTDQESGSHVTEPPHPKLQLYLSIIQAGEGKEVEFKSSLCFDIREGQPKDHIKLAVAKTLAAFMNTDGGFLFIGVDDDGNILGLEHDYNSFTSSNRKDAFKKSFDMLIRDYLGNPCHQYLKTEILHHNGRDFCAVQVERHASYVILRSKNERKFYIRGNVVTEELNVEDAINWVMTRSIDR